MDISPCETIAVIVQAILNLPCLQLGIMEIICEFRCVLYSFNVHLGECVASGRLHNYVELMSGTACVILGSSSHIVCDTIPNPWHQFPSISLSQ